MFRNRAVITSCIIGKLSNYYVNGISSQSCHVDLPPIEQASISCDMEIGAREINYVSRQNTQQSRNWDHNPQLTVLRNLRINKEKRKILSLNNRFNLYLSDFEIKLFMIEWEKLVAKINVWGAEVEEEKKSSQCLEIWICIP